MGLLLLSRLSVVKVGVLPCLIKVGTGPGVPEVLA